MVSLSIMGMTGWVNPFFLAARRPWILSVARRRSAGAFFCGTPRGFDRWGLCHGGEAHGGAPPRVTLRAGTRARHRTARPGCRGREEAPPPCALRPHASRASSREHVGRRGEPELVRASGDVYRGAWGGAGPRALRWGPDAHLDWRWPDRRGGTVSGVCTEYVSEPVTSNAMVN
jgi:hypothetical protein